MESRINLLKVAPEVYKAMVALDGAVKATGLESSLLHLIKLRASQINGCAFCIDIHSKEARADGETEQRIYLLDAWREAPFYSDRERAALAWTEAVTLISQGHAPDEVYEQARQEFSEDELMKLNLAIVSINGWNRFAIAFRAVPGQHQPTRPHAMATAGA
jgi:AhpD family alkylhydroperoxidase